MLSFDEEVFLNWVEQLYTLNGQLPTREKCLEVGFTDEVELIYGTGEKTKEATENLLKRGLSRDLFKSNKNGVKRVVGVLSELQLTAANVMLDLRDNRSQKKKLSELGISTGTWDKWLKDASFQNYLRARAENLLGDNQHEAHYALLNKVRAGDLNAIKYFNQMTGRFTESSASGSGAGNLDVKLLLTRVIEAIQKHVKDPETIEAIGQEILAYAQVQGLVNSLTNNVIPIPPPVGATIPEPRALPTGPSGLGANL